MATNEPASQPNASDIDRLVSVISERIPVIERGARSGWRGQVELAALDAVFANNARYGNEANVGVRAIVDRYARSALSNEPWDSLQTLSSIRPEDLREVVMNNQLTGGVRKYQAVIDAARNLSAVEVESASDVRADSTDQRRAWTATPGLGFVSWNYFGMLLGQQNVKPDRMVVRFVSYALNRPVSAMESGALLRDAAEVLGESAIDVDHAVWSLTRSEDLN